MDLDDWSCPICMDLLYKPCVNTCGHVFCFWCMHNAMDPYQPSQCPMCRSSYQHFPKVCERLHSLLSTAFPEQYGLRAAENKEKEQETGVESPDISSSWQLAGAQAVDSSGVPAVLCCDHPGCGKLLVEPLVLSCGHTVCRWLCAPGSEAVASSAAVHVPAAQGQGQQQGKQQEREGQQPPMQQRQQHEQQQGQELPMQQEQQQQQLPMQQDEQKQQGQQTSVSAADTMDSTSSPAAAPSGQGTAAPQPASSLLAPAPASTSSGAAGHETLMCPACSTPIVCVPNCCLLLSDLAAQQCPEQHTARLQQVQAAQAAAERRAASAGASGSSPVPPAAAASGGAFGRAAASPSPAAAGPSRALGSSPRPPAWLAEEMRNRAAGGGATWQVLWAELMRHADIAYTWHGVGCDDCGVYPVLGRRYRCKDCPETIGYDLCGLCYDGGLAGRGRFNQNHKAEHRMEKMEPHMSVADPVSGMLNCMQALHPELSVDQILRYLQWQLVREDDPSAGNDGSDEEGADTGSGEEDEDDAYMAAEWADGQAVAVPLAAILPGSVSDAGAGPAGLAGGEQQVPMDAALPRLFGATAASRAEPAPAVEAPGRTGPVSNAASQQGLGGARQASDADGRGCAVQ